MMLSPQQKPSYVGILLAAGSGRRFDPTGSQNKLLQRLPGGATVVAAAAANLLAAVGKIIAVVPTGSPGLAAHLSLAGYRVTKCEDVDTGMAASLVHSIHCCQDAAGWIIALGDMPFVAPATIQKLVSALEDGADIAAPSYLGMRGNPVAFGRVHLESLLQLSGDKGGRVLLQNYPVLDVPVDDPGVCQDIDTVSDLNAYWAAKEKTHA